MSKITEEIIIEEQEPKVDREKSSSLPKKLNSFVSGYIIQPKDADRFCVIFVTPLFVSTYMFSRIFQKYDVFPQFIRDFPETMVVSFLAMVFAVYMSFYFAVRNYKTLAYLLFSVLGMTAGFFCTTLISVYFRSFDTISFPGMLLYFGVGYYTIRTSTLKIFCITFVAWEIILISSLASTIYIDYDWSRWGLMLFIVFVIWCLLGLLFCFPSFVTGQRRVLHDIIGCLILPLNMMYNCQVAEKANQQLTYEDKEQFFYELATFCVFVESAILFLVIHQIVERCQEDSEEEALE